MPRPSIYGRSTLYPVSGRIGRAGTPPAEPPCPEQP